MGKSTNLREPWGSRVVVMVLHKDLSWQSLADRTGSPPRQEPGNWATMRQPQLRVTRGPLSLGPGIRGVRLWHGPLGGPGSSADGWAGQACGELKIALLGHFQGRGWWPRGDEMGSWAMDRLDGDPGHWEETDRAVDALRDAAAKTNANIQCSH